MTRTATRDLSYAKILFGKPFLSLYEKRGHSVRRDVAVVIIVATLLRLLFALLTGMGVDESYTVHFAGI